jgi:hypothetical protein
MKHAGLFGRVDEIWGGVSPEVRHHGLPLAAAVVLALGATLATGLPEPVWAPMSALIVMRPNADSTIAAGWDRAVGTMIGALCGILGVCMVQLGANALVTTLAIVAGSAMISVAGTNLRSVPVAALVVLTAAALPGHTALQVALLRVVQIAIGVGAAMTVSLTSSRYRASERLRSGSAKLLRSAAQRVARAGAPSEPMAPNEAGAERASAAVRLALAQLSNLARSADRPRPWAPRPKDASQGRYHRHIATLVGRVLQDVTLFQRVALAASQETDPAAWREAVKIVSAALGSAACAIEVANENANAGAFEDATQCATEDTLPADLAKLGELGDRRRAVSSDCPTVPSLPSLLAAPIHLLFDDLRQLCQGVRGFSKHAMHSP